MANCTNCDTTINENYCSNCGQSAKLKRIDRHYVSHEFLHLLHFEKGFFFTVKELITRPGHSIREFITFNRSRHMKPIAFLILSSLLYTLIAHYFHADEINNSKEKISLGSPGVDALQHWTQAHYGYANIIMGIFIAFCVKLIFRKYGYNFFEIMILLCFAMGQGMLLLAFQSFFIKLLSLQAFQTILLILGFVYPTWVIGQFFDAKKALSYIKAVLAYILGYFLFGIAMVIVGLLADFVIKLF